MALTQPPLPPFPWADIPIILALVALNGVFAMCELAIVSARRPRLRTMASAGHRGAAMEELDLPIRAGLHAGEIEIRQDDIAGIAVHVAARIAGLAGAHQTMVSSTVKDLVAGSGFAFSDQGEQELKGVEQRWRCYSLEPTPAMA